MTNYESNSYHVTDEVNDTSAAFSTLPPGQADGDAVMKLWHTTTLPDGQPLNVAVCFTSDDVRGLQSYLNDQFGGRRFATGGKLPAEAGTLDFYPHDPPFRLPKVGEVIPVMTNDGDRLGNLTMTGKDTGQFQPDVDLFHEQAAALTDDQPRRCAVIYNGIQCEYPDDATIHGQFGHLFHGLTQTGDGAATPPADPTTTPAATGGDQAAESATAAGTAEAAPSPSTPAEKPKRKRRTKVEKAYDDALDAYVSEKTLPNSEALATAYDALRAKEPEDERVRLHFERIGAPAMDPEAAAVPPGEPHGQAWIGPSFAPDPTAQYQAAGQVLIDAANDAGYDVPAFAPGQAPQLGAVEISPQEQQAAGAFPCPVQSSDGRTCQRPYGHEIQTATNPEPKPHVYATVPSQLGITSAQAVQAVEMSQPAFQAAGHPMPTAPLSFRVPPTPAEAPTHAPSGAEMQPPAPAAPFWQQPQGGGQ